MEDYSSERSTPSTPSTQEGYQGVIDRNIIPMIGRVKVQDLKRPDVVGVMEKLAHRQRVVQDFFQRDAFVGQQRMLGRHRHHRRVVQQAVAHVVGLRESRIVEVFAQPGDLLRQRYLDQMNPDFGIVAPALRQKGTSAAA